MENTRILVVDDNEALQEDFKKILLPPENASKENIRELRNQLFDTPENPKPSHLFTEAKYELEFASQGEEALKKVIYTQGRKTPFALVFMDIRMPPGWDGVTTIKKIWEVDPGIQVVICSAYSDYSFEDLVAELGISNKLLILKKPFDSIEVRQLALTLTTKWNIEKTARERTRELEIQRAKNASSAKMASLGEMAGGIAHEINNPLAIISGNASILKEVLEGEINREKALKLVEKIESTATRIGKIIKGLRSITRNGDNDPFVATNLDEIVTDLLQICQQKFKTHDIELAIEKPSLNLVVECRATQIGQVILNLLNNAYDAIQLLDKKWVKLEARSSEDNIEILITDSGTGLSKEAHDKIFQPFFTTKEVGKGTGLGLSISKGIAETHRGTLSIDGSCQNTRFILKLPFKQNNLPKEST